MQFQLLNLIIWPKSQRFIPQIVQFQPGKLNVITGASRTGKSAIIPIIDYCLGSQECSIPIDTIRDHAVWYGVIVKTTAEEILFAREVPVGNVSSNNFYLMRGSKVVPPISIDQPNEKLDGIKNLLDGISGVPYATLNADDNRGFNARLSFRDLMAFVFQSQDIVANQNILFYKTHAHEHREKLRNWFPFIIGAENMEILAARNRIQEIERQLSRLRRDFEKAKTVSDSWIENMQGHLRIASEYGLVDQSDLGNKEPEHLLEIAKNILENIPNHPQTTLNDIEGSSKEVLELDILEEELSLNIGKTKKRLADLNELKGGFMDYGNSVRRRKDRLHISQWLLSMHSEAQECPSCGSVEHPKKNDEITKISNAFRALELESKKLAEVPTSFAREEEKLRGQLTNFLEEKKQLQNRIDLLAAKDQRVQQEMQQRKNMFMFLGHLKAHLEFFSKLNDGGEFKKQIEDLDDEIKRLTKLADINGVHARINAATAKIGEKILNHLKTLDVEDKYKEVAPRFDIKNLNLSVLSNDNHWHYLGEVGSASNWVSFHIALVCALQEFFLELKNSSVPSFVIFDQPSQVYFPKLKKVAANDENRDIKFEDDEDVSAVKSIFKTISNSIKISKGLWQALILDHADDIIYGDIDLVYEVDIWRDGKKLIPTEWILGENDSSELLPIG
ncbi:DUF3732 domain-containing protein [Chryseobacterium shandongense]|uniref:DUF3732 domain-containing protein n=1 Tax=Chryseobacterium shandongense TaxID=1493872 RepID=A0AAD0YIC6_9FLAO|nr:DUF3732 domain-containing protein [Chryseobacterium shandongense]AZA88163.1 DUF3732 domain-containing protein [Chryseobacterium shandongense]AZA96724.1 DUF3732 domain-containing protein [Chryseobacterium shandongense]